MKKTGLLVLILALVMSLFVTAMAADITASGQNAIIILKGQYSSENKTDPVVKVPEVWHIDVAANALQWDVKKTTNTGGTKTYEWNVPTKQYTPSTSEDITYSLTVSPENKTVRIENSGNVIVSCSAYVTMYNDNALASLLNGHVTANPPSGNLDASSNVRNAGNVRVDINTSGINVDNDTLYGLTDGTYEIGYLTVNFYKEGLVPVPEG